MGKLQFSGVAISGLLSVHPTKSMNKEITHTCDTSRLSQARDSMCHACV